MDGWKITTSYHHMDIDRAHDVCNVCGVGRGVDIT